MKKIMLLLVLLAFSLFASDLEITQRVMTDAEYQYLKNKIGVYEQGRNYNVHVGTHGTGLKPPTEQEWQQIKDMPILIDQVKRIDGKVSAAPSFDNSASNWFPPIGNQDGEGSCVAWAIGYYVKTFQEAKEHGWDLSGATWDGGYYGHPNSAYQNKIMSPDFIYHQINDGVDEGSYYSDAMDLLARIGCCTWDRMPYDPNDFTTWPGENAWRQAPLYRAKTGYSYMWTDTDSRINELKTIIEAGNCVVISINADEYTSLTSNDLWTANAYQGNYTNHANTIVGYDDNYGPYTENGISGKYGAFKVANSWGKGGWENQDDGFYYISYACMRDRIEFVFKNQDRINYNPKYLAVYKVVHNNRADCKVSIGLGETSNPSKVKEMDDFIGRGGSHPFPNNRIAADISGFDSKMNHSNDHFFLNVYDGAAAQTGTINYFCIEEYADYASGNPIAVYYSDDTPKSTSNYSNNYVFLETGAASPTISLSSSQFTLDNGSGSESIDVTCNNTSGDETWSATVTSGASWLSISAGTFGDGDGSIYIQYSQNTIPTQRSATLQVTADWATNSPQSIQFTQAAGPEGYIAITSPNGGEVWQAGTEHRINWNSSQVGSAVNIAWSSNNGSDWTTIVDNVNNDGSYNWTVPDVSSTLCLVRVKDAGSNISDKSNKVFTIWSPYFTYRETEDYYPVLLENSTLEGGPLNIGDQIGVFASDGAGGSICAGSVLITGMPPYSIQAWGDDSQTPDKDGFQAGETLHFRLWDQTAGVEYGNEYQATYTSGDGTWGSGTVAVVDLLEFLAGCSMPVNLQSGWNWISCPVSPENPDMAAVWFGVDGLNIVKGMDGFHVPGSVNSLGNWQHTQMYKVHMGASSQLVINGSCVPPNDPIALAPGWNWTAYLPAIPMDAEVAMAGIADKLTIVKAMNGFYVPGTINSIGNLVPCKGYKLHLNQDATLVYPEDGATLPKRTVLAKSSVVPGRYFSDFTRTEDYQAVVIDKVAPTMQPGMEIGLFTQTGLCIGSAMYTGTLPVAVMAWADNPATDRKDGYAVHDELTIKVWDDEREAETQIQFNIKQGNSALGTSPLLSLVLTNMTQVPNQYALYQNYPNPFNPVTTIRYDLPQAGHVTLDIYNIRGELIRTLFDGQRDAGSYTLTWDTLNDARQPVASGLYFYRLNADNTTFIRKLTLLK